ncbi:MAG: NUDIX domain-containing protein [Candidatus Nomurabacteria bacterium]|nr:NUDIX domain-containing protein [Candidatus Nomurabacteria bacterium]
MKTLTLALLFRDEKILLAMKKRKFGVGKWNGYGGKLDEGEMPIDGLVREIKEESNLNIPKELCKELGYIDFYFNDKEEWNQRVIIYRIDNFVGEPEETEEMMPKWFPISEIPWHEMWKGDDQWIPYVITNKKFKGEVHFSEGGEKLVSCVVK